jgi:hypothetical protein
MLPEERRAQLDGIVQQMVANKEPDSNIRFVVDDFKKKYAVQEAQKPMGETGGAIGSLAKFTGIEPIGRGLGAAIGNAVGTDDILADAQQGASEIQGRLVTRLQEARANGEDTSKWESLLADQTRNVGQFSFVTENIVGGGVTPKQVIGSAASTLGTVAAFGALPGVGQATSAIGKAVPQLGGKVGQAAVAGALGTAPAAALAGAGATLQNEGSFKEAAKNAFYSGLAGAALGGAVGGGLEGFKELVKKGAKVVTERAIGVEKRVRMAGKSPAPFLNDEGLWGSLGTYKKAAKEGMKQADEIIEGKLSKTPGTVDYSTIKAEAAKTLEKKFGNTLGREEIDALIEAVPAKGFGKEGASSYATANKVRKELDGILNSGFFLNQNTKPASKEAMGAVAGALRKAVQAGTNTADDFARYSSWVQTSKAVDNAIAATSNKTGVILDLVVGGVGFGGTQGSFGDRLKGAAQAVAAERVIRSTTAQTLAAQLLPKLSNLLTSSGAKGLTQAGLAKLIGEASAPASPSSSR